MTTLYRLDISPDESAGEGEDWDEWFTSLSEAKTRRRGLIAANPTLSGLRHSQSYAIHRIVLAPLPKKALVLAVLRRLGYSSSSEFVVDDYSARPVPPIEED